MRMQKSSMLGFCFFTDGVRGKTHKILDIALLKAHGAAAIYVLRCVKAY